VEEMDQLPHAASLQVNLQTHTPPRWARHRSSAQVSVECMPHPLPTSDYIDLVRHSDVGLFLYDRRRYFARCSGVLVEMLSSGVPVIVPAGSWLAAQIAAENQRWLADVAARFGEDDAPQWDAEHRTADVSWPRGAGQALLEFELASAAPPTQLQAVQAVVRQSTTPATSSEIEIVEGDGRLLRMLVTRKNEASSLGWEVRPAFDAPMPSLVHTRVRFLPTEDAGLIPQGAVGIAFGTYSAIPGKLREIVDHHRHYRREARRYAEAWRLDASADVIVARLAERDDAAAYRTAVA
ncbi:MAG: hypothetical protein KDA61_18390, partial [Planctomycetales bacterium]|nr:hypothetical protein [Planctomycetales bacterium]